MSFAIPTTHRPVHLALLTLSAVLALGGCASDTATTDTGDDPGATMETIGWDLVTENVVGIPQGDVEVCSEAGCDISNGAGQMHLELPVGESRMTMSAEGVDMDYFLTIVDIAPKPDRILVPSPATMDLLLADLPEWDRTKGAIIVSHVFEPGHTDSLNVEADGPYYVNDTFGGVVLDATSTTGSGIALYVNVPLGDVEITFTPPEGRTCLQTPWSQAGAGTNTTRVQTSAGVISSTDLDCR